MKNNIITVLLCMAGILLLTQGAYGSGSDMITLNQGTVSLSGSSNIFFSYAHDDTSSATRSYRLSVLPGYFVKDNLELSVQLSGYFSKSDVNDWAMYDVIPFIIYHHPLTEVSYVFGGLGAGYTWSKWRYGPASPLPGTVIKSRATVLAGLLGWEYFVSSDIALHVKIAATRRNYSDDNNGNTITSLLGFSLYFQ